MTGPIVIVGSGIAGYTTAREFRKLDRDTPLLVLTRDDGAFYSKPMLSAALAQGKTPEALANALAPAMAADNAMEVRAGVSVEGLDTAARRLRTDQGELGYSALVLALGADPVRLPLGGDGADAVLSVNDRQDYARFRALLQPGARVLILGAGLVGCEFAHDLAATGHRPTVVDPFPAPLSRLLPPQAGAYLRDALAAKGIAWRFGDGVAAVHRDGAGYRVELSGGDRMEGDLVLSAVGLRPRTALASAAGLATGRGILVNRELRTSAPDVYALGDCAEVEGLVLPYVMPAMNAAWALARTLAGTPTPVAYPAMPVAVKTPACPVNVCPPPPGVEGEWTCEALEGGVRALYRRADGGLAGFALVGSCVGEKMRLAREIPPWLADAPG